MKSTLTLILLLLSLGAFSQTGTLVGSVKDQKTNESLIGALVTIQGVPGKGASTDLNGQYIITKIPAGRYDLVIKYVGYASQTVTGVEIVAGKTTSQAIYLTTASKAISEVTVSAEVIKTSVSAMQLMQKNSASLMDGTSADQIKRSPDRNTAEVLRRSSGTTIQDGRFAIVRGLSDRYNLAMVNGAVLPGTEPDRKVFSFDLFPAAILDNLVITKTAQPDLPGEFAGGLIQLNTKDIPDSSFLQVGLNSTHHSLATFQDFKSYQGSSTDWLGYDNSFRTIPASMPSRTDYIALTDAERYKITKDFADNYAITTGSALPFYGLQLTGGWRKNLGKSDFGLIGAITYSRNQKVNHWEVREFNAPDKNPADTSARIEQFQSYNDTTYQNEVNWGTLLNMSLRIGANHKISIKNSLNLTSDNTLTTRQGYRPGNGNFDNIRSFQYEFISNRLLTQQIGGEHSFLKGAIRLDWGGSISSARRNTPDLRRLRYYNIPDVDSIYRIAITSQADLNTAGRFYSELEEGINSGFLNLLIPFKIGKQKQEFKTGVYVQTKDRTFDARILGYQVSIFPSFNFDLLGSAPDSIFSDKNIGDEGFVMSEVTNPTERYTANSRLTAGYAMLNNRITSRLRAVWGVRFENFEQNLDSRLQNNDPVTVRNKFNDILPSVNLIYSVTENSNLRLAASKTVSRPEFREIAPFPFYDFNYFSTVQGETSLRRTSIFNYDVRYEWFRKSGQMISLGAFYKEFEDPIEQYFKTDAGIGTARLISWLNSPRAVNYGAEFVLRQNFGFLNKKLETLIFSANLSYIISEIDINTTRGTYTRPMQGQSPYIVNLILQYQHPKTATGFSILFNQIGRRIAFVGIPDFFFPELYENPRPLLDLQISQRLFKNATLTLNIQDLINQSIYFYQDYNNDKKFQDNLVRKNESSVRADQDIYFIRNQPGRQISLSFNWLF